MLYEITVVHRVIAQSVSEAIKTLVEYETDSISHRVLVWEGRVGYVGSTTRLVSADCESVKDSPDGVTVE